MKVFKTLVVCGDSFNSIALSDKPEYNGTHWSELLSKKLQCELVNLANPGCSNRMIAFQLLEALQYTDALVIGSPAACYTRFDLLRDPKKSFESNITLNSFERKNIKNKDAFLLSANINFLERESGLSNNIIRVLLEHIPIGMYKQIDKWAIFYALSQLKKNQADVLFFQNTGCDDVLSISELEDVLGLDQVITPAQFNFRKYHIRNTADDPGYHTTPAAQIEIANYIFSRIANE